MAVEIELPDLQQEEAGGEQPQGKGKNEEKEKNSRKTAYIYYLGLVVVVIGFASCVMQLQFHGTI